MEKQKIEKGTGLSSVYEENTNDEIDRLNSLPSVTEQSSSSIEGKYLSIKKDQQTFGLKVIVTDESIDASQFPVKPDLLVLEGIRKLTPP